MKKKLLLFTILFASFNLFSQIDIKINPIGLLFNSPDVVGEYGITDDFGVELSFGLNYGDAALGLGNLERSGYNILGAGKYYFNQSKSINKFFAGVYLKQRSITFTGTSDLSGDIGYENSAFAGGFLIGYKWVSSRGIVFELAGGIGRAFSNNITFNDPNNEDITVTGIGFDGVSRLAIGYRFGGGDN